MSSKLGRRSFLQFLASIPIVGKLIPAQESPSRFGGGTVIGYTNFPTRITKEQLDELSKLTTPVWPKAGEYPQLSQSKWIWPPEESQ